LPPIIKFFHTFIRLQQLYIYAKQARQAAHSPPCQCEQPPKTPSTESAKMAFRGLKVAFTEPKATFSRESAPFGGCSQLLQPGTEQGLFVNIYYRWTDLQHFFCTNRPSNWEKTGLSHRFLFVFPPFSALDLRINMQF